MELYRKVSCMCVIQVHCPSLHEKGSRRIQPFKFTSILLLLPPSIYSQCSVVDFEGE